jgi:hypothetical protein
MLFTSWSGYLSKLTVPQLDFFSIFFFYISLFVLSFSFYFLNFSFYFLYFLLLFSLFFPLFLSFFLSSLYFSPTAGLRLYAFLFIAHKGKKGIIFEVEHDGRLDGDRRCCCHGGDAGEGDGRKKWWTGSIVVS